MDAKKPELSALSIVLLGDFNPKIFHPAWFAYEGLIKQVEADEAKLEINHPEIAIFSLDWFNLQITRDRFVIETKQEPYYEVIRDLVLGTFELLRHTPLRSMGINTDKHFRMESEEKWHTLGHKFAPKEPWSNALENPGLISLTMEGNNGRDGFKGFIRVQVGPSGKIQPGIHLMVNDHYEKDDSDKVAGAHDIVNILKTTWEKSLKRSDLIMYNLLEKE